MAIDIIRGYFVIIIYDLITMLHYRLTHFCKIAIIVLDIQRTKTQSHNISII